MCLRNMKSAGKSIVIHIDYISNVRHPYSCEIRYFPKTKKHKVDFWRVHIDLKVDVSINLEKRAPLDEGMADYSQGIYVTNPYVAQDVSSF